MKCNRAVLLPIGACCPFSDYYKWYLYHIFYILYSQGRQESYILYTDLTYSSMISCPADFRHFVEIFKGMQLGVHWKYGLTLQNSWSHCLLCLCHWSNTSYVQVLCNFIIVNTWCRWHQKGQRGGFTGSCPSRVRFCIFPSRWSSNFPVVCFTLIGLNSLSRTFTTPPAIFVLLMI